MLLEDCECTRPLVPPPGNKTLTGSTDQRELKSIIEGQGGQAHEDQRPTQCRNVVE